MEIITSELQAGLPLELLYADNLILVAESKESLLKKIVQCTMEIWAGGQRFESEYRKNEGTVRW